MVLIIVDDVLDIVKKPKKSDWGNIAFRIVKQHRQLFEDNIDGNVVGNGFESLQKQFICRVENLARTKKSLVRMSDNESTSSDTSSSTSGFSQKRRSVDEYGCKIINL